MGFSVLERNGAVMHIRISGVMTLADLAALQDEARILIARGLKPRALIEFADFGGWAKDPGWDDMAFIAEHGDDIARMAIVGEERWRDQALMFTAKGLRATEIEYFIPDDFAHARQWVSQ
jgi:hypothetical protein